MQRASPVKSIAGGQTRHLEMVLGTYGYGRDMNLCC